MGNENLKTNDIIIISIFIGTSSYQNELFLPEDISEEFSELRADYQKPFYILNFSVFIEENLPPIFIRM